MDQLEKLKRKWESENVPLLAPATDDQIFNFQSSRNLLLPIDLINYFKILNGTGNQYDGSFYQFYSINQIKTIKEEYKDWKGIPNYNSILSKLVELEKYFIFCNYQIHLFSFAIKLFSDKRIHNEVLLICGEQYKKVADSFSDFIEFYLDQSINLQP